jgi:hypothetical protein
MASEGEQKAQPLALWSPRSKIYLVLKSYMDNRSKSVKKSRTIFKGNICNPALGASPVFNSIMAEGGRPGPGAGFPIAPDFRKPGQNSRFIQRQAQNELPDREPSTNQPRGDLIHLGLDLISGIRLNLLRARLNPTKADLKTRKAFSLWAFFLISKHVNNQPRRHKS